MQESAALLLVATISGTSLRAQDDEGSPSPELLGIAREHAICLIELADHAARSKLLNDEERLLLLAKKAQADSVGKERFDLARQHRLAVIKGEAETQYRSFLRSPSYERSRKELADRERTITTGIVGSYVAFGRDRNADQAPLAETAFERAFDLDPTDKALLRAGSRDLVQRLQARRLKHTGLQSLELGPTIGGKDLDLAALRGRVVLWRSYSL